MTFTRQQFEAIARRNIQQSLDNFLPTPPPGQTYVNGSLPRNPHWHYEWQGVKEEAYENTMKEVRGGQ